MSPLVVDASVLIKWVVPEDGSKDALSLLKRHRLVAPDLIVAECANILWKKATRGEMTSTQAEVAARILEQCDVELMPMRHLLRSATDMAIEVAPPAYDCVYLALAAANGWTFVTADERLARKLRHRPAAGLPVVRTLRDVAADV